MTPNIPELKTDIHSLLQEQIRLSIRKTFIDILEEEVATFLQAGKYQHSAKRTDHRNGHYTRDLVTSSGKIEDLPVPRTRKGFQTKVFKRYQRRQAELDTAIAEMFVKGVSTEQVGHVVETLTGERPSASTVSRVFHSLEDEFETWKQRSLAKRCLYAFADGSYFSVVYDQEVCKMPILAVLAIDEDGKRELLGFSTGDRENQTAWETFLDELKARGMLQVDLWITDGNQAMINALESKFPESKFQRCIKHKMENVLSRIPKKQHDAVYPELRGIFYQESREKAEQVAAAFIAKYENTYKTAIECLQRDFDRCLTFHEFPENHWKSIRTTNPLEGLFKQVKKRSKKIAAAFRNENSCLLLFYAVTRSIKFRRITVQKSDPNLHTS